MNRRSSRLVVLAVVLLVVLAAFPGLAAAAPVQGVGGTVVVEAGETVDSVEGLYGSVVIRGTVTGDVSVATGSLVIDGEVQGDVNGAAGSVAIDGQVGGDVNVGAGSLRLGEDAAIGGQLNAGVGSAMLAGTVRGDAAVGGGDIVLARTATFQGDLRYDGNLDDRGATIEGRLVEDRSLGQSVRPFGGVGQAVFDVYGLLVTLAIGAVLLLAFPASSRRLAERIGDDPLKTGLYGLAALVGVPILLVLVAITVIGIPLALIGALLFALAAWIGSVYGRYAVGEWLLGYVGTENRWAALLIGVVAVALIGLVPFLGGLVEFVVLLLGLGGLAGAGLGVYRSRRDGARA